MTSPSPSTEPEDETEEILSTPATPGAAALPTEPDEDDDTSRE
jgi:hypothetical protein